MRLSNELCHRARSLVADRLGLDFPEARRADLEQGLLRGLRASSLAAPEAYLAWLGALPDGSPEWGRLAGHLTVGETYFFRDRATFEALEQHVLPTLIAIRRAEGVLRLRLWSAGCATGEEPYSLAILLHRLLLDHPDWVLTILATDINPEVLETARRGRYRPWSFRETPAWIRDRYFHSRGPDTFELDAGIRRTVTFAPLNLAEDGYPAVVTNTSAMDLVLCRNVLMYFTQGAQRATVARLRRALVPGGWLVVSPAEGSADLLGPLVPATFPGAIFYRKEPAGDQGLGVGDWELGIGDPGTGVRDWGLGAGEWGSVASFPEPQLPAPNPYVSTPLPQPPPCVPQPPTPSPQALLEQARALADQGSLEQARRLCEAALARNRLDPEAHLLLAAICQELGEIPAALDALRRAIYLAPDCAPAHFLLGSLLLRQEEHKRGRRCMETVVSLLRAGPGDEPVPGYDGLTAGRLLEMARAYLDLNREGLGAGG
ncbi:MAG: tetratricopeptide repeat protein [candidate division NC10 bacterium]|nr:tetratricopeptide repeat protein [candidate division NC10 bacterium]